MTTGRTEKGETLGGQELLNSPDYLLYRMDFQRRACVFLEVGPKCYEQSSFLDDRIQSTGDRLHGVDIGQLARAAETLPPPLHAPHFLAHTSFCCSTLLSRTLEFGRRTLVLREPQVLLLLARAFRERPASFPQRASNAYLKLTLRLLNKSYAPDQKVLIKPSNLANRLLAAWLDLVPGSRGVLLSCSLEEYLVSVLRKEPETQEKMPQVARNLTLDSDYLSHFPELNRIIPDPLCAAAVAWHAQRHMLGLLMARHSSRLLFVEQKALLAQPIETIRAVCRHLSLNVGETDIRARVHGTPWRRHAKDPRWTYSPAKRAREYAQTRAKHARRIESAVQWLAPFMERLPDGLARASGPSTDL